MRSHVFRPAAAADLKRAHAWYETQREGLGEEFLAELGMTIEAVLARPEAYPVLHRETRRALVHRFPYGLFYRIVEDTVVFVACFHATAQPGWVEAALMKANPATELTGLIVPTQCRRCCAGGSSPNR